MSPWTVAAALAFGGMLIVTAAVQTRRWKLRMWVRARDPCAYVPWWTFFAPTPGVTDVRLLWREQLVDGGLGPWHEALDPSRGLRRAVWNPGKRPRKAVLDCGHGLAAEEKTADGALALMSLRHLLIAHYVTGLPASPLGAARQFAIVQTQGADDQDGQFELLFVSPWHRLSGAVASSAREPGELPEAARSAA